MGVYDIGMSDHCLVYTIRKIGIPKSNPKIVMSRCFKNFAPDNFPRDLLMVSRHLIELEDNINIAWNIWQQMFLGIADYHAPLKKRRVRHLLSLGYSRAKKQLF